MTTIVGVSYPAGIIMASDLLVGSQDGSGKQESKIYYGNGVIFAFAGWGFSKIIKKVAGRDIWCAAQSVDDLVNRYFALSLRVANDFTTRRISSFENYNATSRRGWLVALLGAFSESRFGLYYCDGSDQTRHAGSFATLSPEGKIFLHYCAADYENALNLALSSVKKFNDKFKESSAGSEAIHLQKDRVERVHYEPIS